MSELKKLEPLSDWVAYELDTKQIDPPILKLRLRYLEDVDIFRPTEDNPLTSFDRFNKMVELVADWDVTQDGKPLPLTEKVGRDQLTDFLVRKVVGQDIILSIAVVRDAQDRELFLKN